MFPRSSISNVSHDIPTNGEVSGSSSLDYGDSEEAPSAKFGPEDAHSGNVPNGLGNGEVSNPEDEDDDDDGSPEEQESCALPFSVKSIQITASSVGISNLRSDVAEILAEELCYKVKELLYVSKMVMQREKRRHLTKSAVSRAVSMLGGVSLHGGGDTPSFIPVPPAGVLVHDDPEIDIVAAAFSQESYTHRPEPCIQAQWLLPDGYLEESSSSVERSPYYTKISKAILNGKPSHLKLALRDLQTNPKIGPLCPFFMNLMALTVMNVNRDIPLTNALIATVHAIAHNRFVDSSVSSAVERVANALFKIVIEKVVHKNYDDLSVRIRAGLLLAKVVEMWKVNLELEICIIRGLLKVLLDFSIPLQSHYGAIVALTAWERTMDDHEWLVLEMYLTVLDEKQNSESYVMIQFVICALMSYLKIKRKKVSSEQTAKLYVVEEMLYVKYGDTITPLRLAWMEGNSIVKRAKATREPSKHKLELIRPSVKYKKHTYAVHRDLRFTKSLHLSSPAGDIFLPL